MAALKALQSIPAPPQWPVLRGMPDMAKRSSWGKLPVTHVFHEYYKEYGPIFQWNMPQRRTIVVNDPEEAVKVIQKEGQYPYGGAEAAWPWINFYRKAFTEASLQFKIMDHGERWKEARKFLAPGIMPPKAAKSFIPAVARAAALASENADKFEDDFDGFINRSALDMFAAVALGEFLQTSSPSNFEHIEFLECTIAFFQLGGQLISDPLGKYKFQKVSQFNKHLGRSYEIAADITLATLEKFEKGVTSEFNESSYMAKLISEGHDLQKIQSAVMALLQAGVDTTGYITNWMMLNLAMNPDKQQKLREELRATLNGADLAESDLENLPYLKAAVRESHRLTPPLFSGLLKKAPTRMEMYGYDIPPDTFVCLSLSGRPWDPEYFDDPKEYRPERFLPEEVAKRKGTAKESLDHQLFSKPFSAGARQCVGARIAHFELLTFTARMVQDWNMEIAPGQSWDVKQFLMLKPDPFPKFRLSRAS